jgi:hypothetical protein
VAKTLRIAGITTAIVLSTSICVAQGQRDRGGPPRPAERPAAYGCSFRDLNIFPNTVREGARIENFLVKYQCKEKTRPVDIEISHELVPGASPILVKIATDVVLEKGEHTLRLTGGDPARGGRYITVLKADAPNGKTEVTRRVDPAVCRGWQIDYVGKKLNARGCEMDLRTDPKVFKTGERIDKFILSTNCSEQHLKKQIKISWEPSVGEHPETKRELVKVAVYVNLPRGSSTLNLAGGGIGREGYYVLQVEDLTADATFRTNCTGWTLSK